MGKINMFPNKLATAIAWNEESIREENEFAENDEGGFFAPDKSQDSAQPENRSVGLRNNKIRTSQDHGII
jgi:hypothetical protein